MDILVSKYNVDEYISAFNKLILAGCRRFIIRGVTPLALEFRKKVTETFAGYTDTKLILTDQNKNFKATIPEFITPDRITFADNDALLIFTERPHRIIKEYDEKGISYKHIIYPSNKPSHKILLSFEKCGTHLVSGLLKLLNMSTKSVDQYLSQSESLDAVLSGNNDCCKVTHHLLKVVSPVKLYRAMEMRNMAVLFNYRDPRAQALSFVNFYSSKKFFNNHKSHKERLDLYKTYSAISTENERLKVFFRLNAKILSDAFHLHAPLLTNPNVCVVRYEDLVGPKGGGDKDTQIKSIRLIMRYLSVGGCSESVANDLYDINSDTFNTGKTDAWREHFTPEIMDLFREKYRGVLETYGYDD